jgi:hypothetical protein
MSDTLVYIRSAHSKLHKGYRRDDGAIATYEGCNIDDVDEETRLVESGPIELIPPQYHRCERCFSSVVIQGTEETVTA